eukprot:tig00000523_g1841.t1
MAADRSVEAAGGREALAAGVQSPPKGETCVKLKVRYGGTLIGEGRDRYYKDGEIRLVTFPWMCAYSDLMYRLAEQYGPVTLKYALNDGDLVTVRSQEDVNELCAEYREMRSTTDKRYIEAYLFDAMESEHTPAGRDSFEEPSMGTSINSSISFSEYEEMDPAMELEGELFLTEVDADDVISEEPVNAADILPALGAPLSPHVVPRGHAPPTFYGGAYYHHFNTVTAVRSGSDSAASTPTGTAATSPTGLHNGNTGTAAALAFAAGGLHTMDSPVVGERRRSSGSSTVVGVSLRRANSAGLHSPGTRRAESPGDGQLGRGSPPNNWQLQEELHVDVGIAEGDAEGVDAYPEVQSPGDETEEGEVIVYRPPTTGRKEGSPRCPMDICDRDSFTSIKTCLHGSGQAKQHDAAAEAPSSAERRDKIAPPSQGSACSSSLNLQEVALATAEAVLVSTAGDAEPPSPRRRNLPFALHGTSPAASIGPGSVAAGFGPGMNPLSLRRIGVDRNVPESNLIPFSDLDLGEPLGSGGFGEVVKANWRGTEVAVKRLYHSVAPKILMSEFREEVALLSRLRHPNIVLFMGWCAPPELSIVTELCWGSLYTVLRMPSVVLQWPKILKLAFEIAKGMNYLHNCSPAIVHLDLKSQNILVDSNMTAKIGDFGLSRYKMSSFISGRHGMRGTFGWMAPEVIEKVPFDEKADVWSYGILLCELCTRRDPFEGKDQYQIVYEVMVQKTVPDLPASVPAEFRRLVLDCLEYAPARRPKFIEILNRVQAQIRHMKPELEDLIVAPSAAA